MAAKDFIVAIELGSSKMTGIAGTKKPDGSIKVLAVVKEDATSCITKGVVYNIDKTVQCLKNIVSKLQNQLKTEITQIYVGVGGKSIRSVRNSISKNLPAGTSVTQEMIDELKDANRNWTYPDLEILDAVEQEYRVDSQLQLDPVGIPCSRLDGNFLNILERVTYYKNLNKCLEEAGITVAEMYLAPLALADSVLTENERRAGCALVDIGADTTTVSVYSKDILRHLSVIPLGSNNITKDIATLQMEDSEAEKMKLKYACAYTDNTDIDNTLMLPIDAERSIENRKFVEIVEGRMEEIIGNVWNQIPNDYCDKLLGGIILTGGGSNMKDITKAFTNYTHVDKIRVAKFVTHSVESNNADINAKNGTMNTVIGLLVKGDLNCAGEELSSQGDLFGGDKKTTGANAATGINRPPRKPSEVGQGIIITEAEKQKAEEEKQKAIEEELRRQKEQEEEEKRLRKENSPINKLVKGMGKFFKKIAEEE